jgi:hypothetical protein
MKSSKSVHFLSAADFSSSDLGSTIKTYPAAIIRETANTGATLAVHLKKIIQG